MKIIIKSILILISFSMPCFSFADQATTERILDENRSFIDFLNICVTNFGDQGKTDVFKNVYQMHFNAFIAYLQSDYKRAYNGIYNSQAEQEKLCADFVKNIYLEDAKDILDKLAPLIVRSKSPKSRLYLTLGYRDRTVGRNNYVVGMASNPKMHSSKIYEFIKAIKSARRAKRYGFLALYESQPNEMKLRIFNYLIEMENKSGNPFYSRFLGKSGEAFMNEMNKIYDRQAEPVMKKDGADTARQTAGTVVKDSASINAQGKTEVYESQIQKRVRFRNEARLAKHLLFSEFDTAGNFMRDYIDDLDYKIILSAIEVLSSGAKGPESDIDYNSFKLHHSDNYTRLFNKSVIQNFADTLTVQDDIKNAAPDSGTLDTIGSTKIVDKKENVIDKKDISGKEDRIKLPKENRADVKKKVK